MKNEIRKFVDKQSSSLLFFSVGDFSSPVLNRSAHTKQIDTILHKFCQLVAGCLKNTPLTKIYQLTSIALPNTRRKVIADWERTGVETDIQHPLHKQNIPNFKLRSRKSFFKMTQPLEKHSEEL